MASSSMQSTGSVPDRMDSSSMHSQRPCCPLQPRRPPSSSHMTLWLAAGQLAVRSSAGTAPIAALRVPQRAARFATAAESPASSGEPKLAADAIAAGLQAYQGGDHEGALDLFQRALTLPGTGLKRYRDKPRDSSEEEKQAALYNTACCLGALGNTQDGLKAIAGALEAGYSDYQQLRRDPDLAPLRQSEKFEGLLKRFEPGGGFLGPLLRGFNN